MKTRSLRRSAIAYGVFVAVLVLLWIMANVMVDRVGWDELSYHHPAIRMMTQGWNPVWGGTADGIRDFLGFHHSASYHVMVMPKSVWYYSAAAWFFTRASFALTSTLTPLLFFGLAVSLFSIFREVRPWIRVLVIILMYGLVVSKEYAVDAAVAMGAVGLLAAMYDYIVHGRWNFLRLAVFTFWMATSKQIALMQCCIFWTVFTAICLLPKWRRPFWKGALPVGLVSFALFTVASVSPYVCVCAKYGHPLYPKYTCDEKRFPSYNLTWDFLVRNDDAAAMGRFGAWANAFASSDLIRLYYRKKLGTRRFVPEVKSWSQCYPDHSEGSPTTVRFRLVFCVGFLSLLVLGGIGGRFTTVCIFLGTVLLPAEMIGYVRYSPWIFELFALGALMASERWKGRLDWLIALSGMILLTANAPHFILNRAEKIDAAYGLRYALRTHPPKVMVPEMWGAFFPDNAWLLKRQVPELSDAQLLPDPSAPQQGKAPVRGELGELNVFFGGAFKVPSNSCPVCYSDFHAGAEFPSKKMFVLKSFLVTLPANVWNALNIIQK